MAALGAWVALLTPGLAQEGNRTVLVMATADGQSVLESEQIAALRAELPPDAEVVVEYLDANRLLGNLPYNQYFTEPYSSNALPQAPSAVVALNDDAIRIAIYRRRNGYFDSVPIVICGTHRKTVGKALGKWTGVFCRPNVEDTIKFARKIHSKSGSVHLLTDQTVFGVSTFHRYEDYVKKGRLSYPVKLPGRGENKFWNLHEKLNYLRAVQKEDIVLYVGYYDEWRGGAYPTQVVLPRMSEASKAPMFTVNRDAVGAGALGGKVADGKATGRAVGKLVARILQNEPVESIEPVQINAEWLFDHAQLKRWGIEESLLPKESRIVNRPISFWAKNWRAICLGGSVSLAEGAIIGMLLVARRRERRAHAALRESESRMQRLELEISERERQALGHDIHDGLGQYVTALRFQCHRLEKGAAEGRATDADAAGKMAQIASDLATEVRSLAMSQVPLQMASRTLEAGLGELAEMALDEKRLGEGAAGHLYRIAQEATRNAFRHAGATKARIALKELEIGGGNLVVENDGERFAPASGRRAGLGLGIMVVRARMIGGTIEIGSTEEGWTRLTCRFPLEERER